MIDKKYLISLNSSIAEALAALEESSPVNTVLVISGVNNKIEGVLTDGDIRRCLINGGSTADKVETCFNKSFVSVDASASKEQVLKLFDTGKYKLLPVIDDKGRVLDIITIDSLSKIYSKKSHSYVRSMAPVRVSFGGGGSDITSYFSRFGGAVLSSTIRLYARCTLRKRSDLTVNICSHDLNKSLSFPCLKKLIVDGDNDDFSLIVAVINTIKPEFGFDLEIRSDFPIGSGLGGSSAVCVAILGCFSEYREEKWDNYQIAELSFQAERLNLGIAGGWQDQYASSFGGFNYIEFNQKQNIVHPLRVNGTVISELEHRCLLCHTAINRESHSIQETVVSKVTKDEQKDKVEMLKNTQAIKNVLLRGNIDEFGSLLNENWQLKKKFSPGASNADLEAIYETALLNGASGGKLLGAGGGGYFLFVAKVNNRFSLQKALEAVGLSVHNLEFEERGLQTWKLYNNSADIII